MASKLTESEIDALPLTPAAKADLKVHYGYAGAQSRPAAAYASAKEANAGASPSPITLTSSVTGKPVTFADEKAMDANVYKVNGEFDQDAIAKARAERHGPGYTAPVPAAPSYSFTVPSKSGKGGTDAFLWSGTPGEIDAYVKSGHITPERAEEVKAEIVPQTPLGSLMAQPKAAPAYVPLPAATPGASPLLPNVPKPVVAMTDKKKKEGE